jgi:formate C-acetyltransferase
MNGETAVVTAPVVALDQQAAARMAAVSADVEFFVASVAATAPVVPDDGLLAGPDERAAPEGVKCEWGSDNRHYPLNVHTIMSLGIPGIAATARARAAELAGEEANYLRAVARCYEAATDLIARHGDAAEARDRADIAANCRVLAAGPPQSFAQAVQLFWFAWCLRNGRGISSTIGRLDQHLHPFYAADVEAGRLTRGEALGILRELWGGFGRVVSHPVYGLMNLIVGGQDRDGLDATNEVSRLMVETAVAVNDTNPFLSVRIHDRTPADFLDRVVELQLLGTGQGTVYNDEVIVPSLVEYGVPLRSARNYANDGCNEVTIDGESEIHLCMVEAMKSLELALFNGRENPGLPDSPGGAVLAGQSDHARSTRLDLAHESGDFAAMTSWEQFLEAYLDQYTFQIAARMKEAQDGIRHRAEWGFNSPWVGGTFPRVLETGRDIGRGGVAIANDVVFLGSMATVADALAGVKKVVFEDAACTPAEMLEALQTNWEGREPLRQRCLAAPKFGNDDDYVDGIARDVIARAAAFVRRQPTFSGAPAWPALFQHTFINTAHVCGPTPDGRRQGDPVGEHLSPTPGRATHGPTAVIRSVAKCPLAECVGVSIFHVNLSRTTAPNNAKGRALVKGLLTAGLRMGITQMTTAIYDVETLKAAKAEPERYEDLIVRVWGYSARFTTLSPAMQDHIIARAIGG